jgi:hypothetical protein
MENVIPRTEIFPFQPTDEVRTALEIRDAIGSTKAMPQVSQTRQESSARLRWTLVLILFLAAGVAVVRHRHRDPAHRSVRFEVPPADRVVPDAANAGGLSVVPAGQLMTLDPTRKFLVNTGGTTSSGKTLNGKTSSGIRSETKTSNALKPVFMTGDSGWSLQVQLSDADVQFYLDDRASRGFNAVWVGLADNAFSNHPPADSYGNAPFNGADFTNENPKYWERVDRTLTWAAERGITILADPAFVGYGSKDGYRDSYRNSSADVVAAYGQFLGNRYKKFPNIIWLIGGDADPTDSNTQGKLYALAKGIKSADSVHLMTTENFRGTSSIDVWSGAPWLDLDALYFVPADIPARANADYATGTYPVFMMEDWYEGEHSMTDLDVRKEGYWAVLSGGTLGRLFGNYAIWNFTWSGATTAPWKNQLGAAGSVGQEWLGKLFRSREHWKLIPDINHTVMTAGYDPRAASTVAGEAVRSSVKQQPQRAGDMRGDMVSVAARTSDGQTIIAYVPNGNATTITIDMSKIDDPAGRAKCWWFNPRDGSTSLIGALETRGRSSFVPPDVDDWVLVIDSLAAKLPAPGSSNL